ncbi:hypothetical protein CHUAL_004721 [Chamberlinius hualienensis]
MAAVFMVTIPTPEYERQLNITLKKEPFDLSRSFTLSFGSPNGSEKLLLKSDDLQEVTVVGQKGANENGISSPQQLTPTSPNEDLNVALQKGMKQELEIGLKKLNIEASTWTTSADGKYMQVLFPCESQERCEEILSEFYRNGIGRHKESSVSLLPCSVFNKGNEELNIQMNGKDNKDSLREDKIASRKSQFIKSITARLTVAQVVDDVRAGTLITFDFVAMLLLATLIAGFGLMDDSTVSIVASMLVSPLMGPIMALSFGMVINDMQLMKLGLKAEIFGLLISISVGLFLGLVNGPWALSWGKGPWPTGEMSGRGQIRSLWVGMLVALPSGAGVALSILGGNISALVGVAISASLLPPCVNAGILWGNAIVLSIKSMLEDQMETIIYHNQTLTEKPSLLPSPSYEVLYSTNMSYESGALGAISLCLTLVNIASIIIMAIIVFKIKEVAPPSSMPETSRFWREDIKIARDHNRTIHKHDTQDLGQQFQKEWKELIHKANGSALNEDSADDPNQMSELACIVQEAEEDEVYQTVRQRSQRSKAVSPLGHQLTWIPEADSSKPPPVWDGTYNN